MPKPPSVTPSQQNAEAPFGDTSHHRLPVELRYCAGVSLLPLHSAVVASRLTSWLSTMSQSCCALSGYPLSHLSRTLTSYHR
ncbi:hypothetical protein GUJ93_ZPchr0003g17359 [Zizania palustris]|uniref:Uncharacterized protein n=1 Tax=Zizania palustris TaxID=103762 RepID=A0A8J5RWV4_ZIZPA|nr:hypothetical protein GUJ93_ZPchr0003g17359 [Zizania palustris]